MAHPRVGKPSGAGRTALVKAPSKLSFYLPSTNAVTLWISCKLAMIIVIRRMIMSKARKSPAQPDPNQLGFEFIPVGLPQNPASPAATSAKAAKRQSSKQGDRLQAKCKRRRIEGGFGDFPPILSEDQLISTKHVCAWLSRGRTFVDKLYRTEKLNRVKSGRSTRVPVWSVNAYLESIGAKRA